MRFCGRGNGINIEAIPLTESMEYNINLSAAEAYEYLTKAGNIYEFYVLRRQPTRYTANFWKSGADHL